MTEPYAALLPKLRTIAREAGQVILRFYNDGVSVSTKADGTPVTLADTAAEHVIVPALHHLTPDIPVVAEEAMASGATPDISQGRFWLVDPLDGTKEFIARNGEFTVNIALVMAGQPVMGVIYAPAQGLLFAGYGPGTAFMAEDGRHDLPIQMRSPPPGGLTVLSSHRHASRPEFQDYLAGQRLARHQTCGSSLKFCMLARGQADLYPRFGETSEWDTAAGHAIVEAAGGRVLDLSGQPLRYGKPGFLNHGFIAGI